MPGSDVHSLAEGEKAFFQALSRLGVRYMLVGMSAALLQGARSATDDLDVWFESLSDPRIGEAARLAGGFWVTRSEPPMLGGMSDRLDVVGWLSGLPDFAAEYSQAIALNVDGVELKVLPLDRIIASKRAANRPKDRMVLADLEFAAAVARATGLKP